MNAVSAIDSETTACMVRAVVIGTFGSARCTAARAAGEGWAGAAPRAPEEATRDDALAVARHGGREIEAGGADIAGLDAVDAALAQQPVMVAVGLLAEGEAPGLEEFVVLGEVLVDRGGEDALVADGGDLLAVRQPRGVAVGRSVHAERLRGSGHALGEFAFGAGDVLGDHPRHVVGRLGDQREDRILDADLGSGPETELGRDGVGGVLGDYHLVGQADVAGVELLEQDVEGHHLDDRGRVAGRVGGALVEHLAALCVDHNACKFSGYGGGGGRHRQHHQNGECQSYQEARQGRARD